MVKVIENQNNNENMNLDEENLSLDEAKYNQSTSINLSKYRKDNTTINESKIKTNTSENKFYISPEINKGPWTPSEDELLIEYVKKYGPKRWNVCAEFLKNRTSKQCREHWKNCLDPEIKKGDWTFEEDLILMAFYSKCKGSWSQLIHYFNDRTENSIKNRFFSELRKIAANDPNKKEKKRSSKIDLKNLLRYLDQGISEAKKNFMIFNKMTEDQLNEYLKKIEIKFLNKKKDKKKKKLNNFLNRYNLLGKKREKNAEEKNNKIKINNNNDIPKLKEDKTKVTNVIQNQNQNSENNNQTQIQTNNNQSQSQKETNQEDNEEKNNNYNLNNFLEINQMNNPLDTSFTNYDLMDEKSEYDEENEFMKEMNENIEQNNIKRSSSDLIEFILSNGYLSNEGILSLGKR